MNRFFVISLSVLVLGACSSQQRQEPPAPVVSVSRPPASASAPAPEPKPKPPVAPKVQPVQVYAYQHPGEVSPPPVDVSQEQPVPADGPVPGQAASTGGEPAAAPTAGSSDPKPAAPSQTEPPPTPVATPPPPTQSPPPPTQVATAPPPSRNSAAAGLTPATQALAQQAEQQRQMGDYAGAAATLERGLRISPQEAYLWNRLARVRLEQGLPSQAGNLAARSNSLAGDKPTLKQDNWRIIADAKRRAGDVAGAQEAELKARGG